MLESQYEQNELDMQRKIAKRRSCCKMFTLGTAMPIVLYLDILMLMFTFNMMEMNLLQGFQTVTGKTV